MDDGISWKIFFTSFLCTIANTTSGPQSEYLYRGELISTSTQTSTPYTQTTDDVVFPDTNHNHRRQTLTNDEHNLDPVFSSEEIWDKILKPRYVYEGYWPYPKIYVVDDFIIIHNPKPPPRVCIPVPPGSGYLPATESGNSAEGEYAGPKDGLYPPAIPGSRETPVASTTEIPTTSPPTPEEAPYPPAMPGRIPPLPIPTTTKPSPGPSKPTVPTDSLPSAGEPTDTPTTEDPSRCVWAVVACCAPGSANIEYSCFEMLGCPGGFFDMSPCDESIVMAAVSSAVEYYGGSVNSTM